MLILAGLVLSLAAGCQDGADSKAEVDSIPRPDLSLIADSRLVQAVRAAQAEVSKSPGAATAWAQLGHVYQAHNWKDEASVCYRRAAEIEPREFRWLYYLGRNLLDSNYATAADVLARAVALKPDYAPAHLIYGHALRQLGRAEAAREHFSRVAELEPRHPVGELNQGEMALSSGQFETARDHLRRALALDSELPRIHVALAQVFLALGDKEAADRHRRAAALKPPRDDTFPDPLWHEVDRAGATAVLFTRRGLRLLKSGSRKAAVNELQKAFSAGNTDPNVRYNLGTALLELGRYREALDALEGAATDSLSDEHKDAFSREKRALIYDNIGVVHTKLGELKAAAESFNQALHLDPASSKAKSNLVSCYMMFGLADARQGKIRSAEERVKSDTLWKDE